MTNEIGVAYLAWCRQRLLGQYWPRVQRCCFLLSQEDLWWREHESNNSVGNLILHLTGNLNQFVLSAFGGAPDTRDKPREFMEREKVSATELLTGLENTLRESDNVLGAFPAHRLLERTTLQSRERTYLEILSIVVEHFALHTGQIIYITKLRTGKDPGF